jgi:hypothetical protein
VQIALDSANIADPSAMACGFPSVSQEEPAIAMEIAQNESLTNIPGTLGVTMRLNTGARLAGVAQAIPMGGTPGVVIAVSPANQVFYTLSLQSDGSAALNIRDMRSAKRIFEVTREGTCRAHEDLMRLVQVY